MVRKRIKMKEKKIEEKEWDAGCRRKKKREKSIKESLKSGEKEKEKKKNIY